MNPYIFTILVQYGFCIFPHSTILSLSDSHNYQILVRNLARQRYSSAPQLFGVFDNLKEKHYYKII